MIHYLSSQLEAQVLLCTEGVDVVFYRSLLCQQHLLVPGPLGPNCLDLLDVIFVVRRFFSPTIVKSQKFIRQDTKTWGVSFININMILYTVFIFIYTVSF